MALPEQGDRDYINLYFPKRNLPIELLRWHCSEPQWRRYNFIHTMSVAAGTLLGQYEVRSRLGAGGMGEVYRAHDTRLDRDVAIKVLPGPLTSDPDRLRRFSQEARAAAALNHPNILAVHQLATEDGITYLVSELLEGETLRERLNHGAMPPRKAIEYAGQVAHGLAAAHDSGIVHRDLKPENLFVTKDGRVGADPCHACSSCRYCKHCAKEGGTCGVCKRR